MAMIQRKDRMKQDYQVLLVRTFGLADSWGCEAIAP